MSRIKDIKRQIDAVTDAIDAIDADLEAGRLSASDHATERAERERDAGRLLVALRQAQREAHEQDAAVAPAERAERRSGAVPPTAAWWRNPVALGVGATMLLVAGLGAGVAVGRWASGSRGVTTAAAVLPTAPAGGGLPGVTGDVEFQVLRQAAQSDDAPIPTLLEFAHAALDNGRLDEARRVYERVLRRDAKNVEAITHIGSVLYQEGRVEEALAKDEEALRIDPRYVHALWDRTQYLFHAKRDWARTVQAAEAFLQVAPEGPDADNIRTLMAQARAAAKAPNPR